MKKAIYIIGFFALVSCTKSIESYNIETKRPAAVPGGTLFTNAVKVLSDNLASASVNSNPLRFVVKYWAMTTYQDEARYNFTNRNVPQGWWGIMYRDVLQDLKESARIIDETPTVNEAEKANKLAILEVLEVYTWSILVSSFGDIPYTQALNPLEFDAPAYDDAATVYADIMSRLTAAIGKFDASAGSFTVNEDIVYGGNVAKWLKFSNSLRLKLGMILADVDEPAAKQHVEAAAAGSFESAADNAIFQYLEGGQPNSNPLFDDIVLGNRGDYVATVDLMEPLITLNDPRKEQYYKPNNAGVFVGGVVGEGNVLSNTAQPSDKVSASEAPLVFLDYVETEFYKAEAIERGFVVPGTAAEHYHNAIRASVVFWGGTAAEADAYIAQPAVAYATATGTWKQKIAFQKWIALYNRPFDAWIEYRRLDYPQLPISVNAFSGFPNRYQYPSNEQQLNGANYSAAASKIGGDRVETKLFWDVN